MSLIAEPHRMFCPLRRLPNRRLLCLWSVGVGVVGIVLLISNWQIIRSKKRPDEMKHRGFQKVEGNSTYVYSAYLDDRRAPDVDPNAHPVARIFAVLPRNATGQARSNWKCIFWSETLGQPMVISAVIGVTDLNTFDKRSRLMCAMILCSLPTIPATDPPSGVSLTTDVSHPPNNYLRLVDLRKRRALEENNLQTNNSTSSNFTICIPPLFGNYMTTMGIMEFVEMNRLLGAEKFVFYLELPNADVSSCLKFYSQLGIVELVTWNRPSELDEMHNHGQILAQTECLFKVMYRTRYLISQDLDEFIIPTRTTNWREMLDSIHKNKRPEKIDKIASYSFRNLFFPSNATSDSTLKEPFRVGGYELKTLTKTTCLDKSNNWRDRSKVMGRPERLLIWHVHEILSSSLVRKGDVNAMVQEGDGLLFHYRDLGSSRSKNTTNRRMWRYQRELFDRVTSRARSYGRGT